MQQQNDSNGDRLFEQVRDTSSEALSESIGQIEHLGEEALEGAKRAHDRELNKNFIQVKKCIQWLLFFIGGLLAIVLVLALTYLIYNYINDVVTSSSKTEELLSVIINTALVALATLFIDRATDKK